MGLVGFPPAPSTAARSHVWTAPIWFDRILTMARGRVTQQTDRTDHVLPTADISPVTDTDTSSVVAIVKFYVYTRKQISVHNDVSASGGGIVPFDHEVLEVSHADQVIRSMRCGRFCRIGLAGGRAHDPGGGSLDCRYRRTEARLRAQSDGQRQLGRPRRCRCNMPDSGGPRVSRRRFPGVAFGWDVVAAQK